MSVNKSQTSGCGTSHVPSTSIQPWVARCSGILHVDVAGHRANVGPMSNANVGPTFAIDIGPTLVRRNDFCYDGDGPQNDRISIVTKDTSSDSLGAVSVHSLIDWCERSPIIIKSLLSHIMIYNGTW